MRRNLWYLIAFVVVLAAGGSVLFFYTPKNSALMSNVETSAGATDTSAIVPPPLATSTPVTQEISQGERLYQNGTFHFSLIYPDNLHATEYKEVNGALTASFQDPSTNQGFEVYVTPYSGKQIDKSRFLLDEPSGTFKEPTNVVIDGVQATMFYGFNPIMGDTREVWFIRNGFLYEVATYKSLDTWLGQIMQTWKFI